MYRAQNLRAWVSLVTLVLLASAAMAGEEPSQEAPPPDPVPSAMPPPLEPVPPTPPSAAPTQPAPMLVYPAPLLPEDGLWSIVQPRVGAQYFTGPGMGYSNGFTAFDAFVPLYGASPQHLVYTDLRGIISDQSALWGNNVGAGYRYYSTDLDRIFGAWSAWDMRNTTFNRYYQMSGGVETIGRYLDFRSNFYAIVGPQSTQTANFLLCSGLFFQGTNIMAPHFVGTESALTGWDVEVGGPLPLLSRYGVRGYVGAYAYHGDVIGDFGGPQGRLQMRLNNSLDANLLVRNDSVFGTTVSFGGALRWGGVRRQYRDADRQSVFNRYADPVVRNYNVSVANQTSAANPIALTDPGTGRPIVVIHVNNLAAPGGDGSVERPLNVLAPASGLAGINGIILVERGTGTTFNYDQGIVLQNGQRLLGDSLNYTFANREMGICPLPNLPGGRPIITNLNGNAVVLASGNEVAGMDIGAAGILGGSGITGTGITSFNLHDLSVNFASADGIFLSNVAGTGTISNVVVVNSSGNGLNLSTSGGSVLNAQVLNSSFNSNAGNGVLLTTNDTSTMNILFQGGNKLSNGAAGLNTVSNGASTLNVTVVSDPISGNAGPGIRMRSFDTSTTNATITGNTITSNGGNGVAMSSHDTSTINATVSGNTIDSNGRNGVRMSSRDGSTLNATVSGNTITNNGRAGVRAVSRDTSTMNATVNSNLIDTNFDDGIFIRERNASVMTAVANGNTINNSGIDGIFAQFGGNGLSFTANNNTVFNSFDHGIHVMMNGGGSTENVTITGNNIDGNNNGDFGILAELRNASTINANISNNTVSNETTGGIAAFMRASTAINLTADGNNASNNAAFGLGMMGIVGNGGSITADISNNITNTNAAFGTGVALIARRNGTVSVNAVGNQADGNGFLGMGLAMIAARNGTLNATVAGNATDGNGVLGLGVVSLGDTSNTSLINNRADNNLGAISNNIGAGIVFAQLVGPNSNTNLSATISGNSTNGNGFLGLAVGVVEPAGPAANPMQMTVATNTTSGNGAIGLALFNFGGNLHADVNSNTMTGDNTQNVGFGGGLLAASGAGAITNVNFRNNSSSPANGSGYGLFDLGSSAFNVYIPPFPTSVPADNNSGTLNNSGATLVTSPIP